MHQLRSAIASLLLAVAAAGDVRAQALDYPNRPVRLISDSAAGSATDASARVLADKLSAIWGQQVLVLNQPGAGGGISARVASQSPNDGYTLYQPATSPFLALAGAPTSRWSCSRLAPASSYSSCLTSAAPRRP